MILINKLEIKNRNKFSLQLSLVVSNGLYLEKLDKDVAHNKPVRNRKIFERLFK